MHSIVIVARIAKWMDKYVREKGYLNQHDAATKIQRAFGAQYVYVNNRGTLSIDLAVLKRFDALNRYDVVWVGDGWRLREAEDPMGRDLSPAGDARRFGTPSRRRELSGEPF